MKREALVPIDEQLEQRLRDHQRRILEERSEGVSVLFPRADANLRGDRPISTSGYRISLTTWLQQCGTRDELGRPVHITPHHFRHTLGIRLINKDVPQEVVRQIHSPEPPRPCPTATADCRWCSPARTPTRA